MRIELEQGKARMQQSSSSAADAVPQLTATNAVPLRRLTATLRSANYLV